MSASVALLFNNNNNNNNNRLMQDNSSARVLSLSLSSSTTHKELQALSVDEMNVLNNLQVGLASVRRNTSRSHSPSNVSKSASTSMSPAPTATSQAPLLKLPVPITATPSTSSTELIRRPNTPHATKIPSPLGPREPLQPLQSSQTSTLVHRTHLTQPQFYKSTLVRAARQTVTRAQFLTANHHPRHATVLGGKDHRRQAPYPSPAMRQGSHVKQQDNAGMAMPVKTPIPQWKGGPRLLSLSNKQQEVILRGFIKNLHSEAGNLQAPPFEESSFTQAPLNLNLVNPAAAQSTIIPPPQLPSPVSSSPVPSGSDSSVGPCTSPVTRTPTVTPQSPPHVPVPQSCDHVDSLAARVSESESVAAPEPVRVFVNVGLQWPEEEKGEEPVYDPIAHAARCREVFKDIFPTPTHTPKPTPPPVEPPVTSARASQPTPPPVECFVRPPSPVTSDEGYEGSDPDDEDEVDELSDELVDERYPTPAYRRALPEKTVSENEPPQLDLPAEPEPPSNPPPYTPSALASSNRPGRVFIPRSHRNHPEASAHTSHKPNWAQTERRLERAPKARVGWDKTPRGSKRAAESRQFYRDGGAKPLSTTVPDSSNPAQAMHAEWIRAVRIWYAAGRTLFDVSDASGAEEEVRRKRYARALKRALWADDGFPPGVQGLYPPQAMALVDFLYRARAFKVDERWGEGAVALKSRIEEYAVVVEDKLRAMRAVGDGNAGRSH